ncbi:uncharacterized protein LOC126076248 [Elephas maximus indicus]|uniref:uncharacterized protein LOC126076248 n=1 Tax=Elephas maximus indicus TaxID=99487 RepID=UPI002117210E|nr:uncharacterized protein LOC126076248 [Elephas maximus indicus]
MTTIVVMAQDRAMFRSAVQLCEERVTYSEVRFPFSSNIQKRKQTKTLKKKESQWCLAAVVFAVLYLIALVIAAVMIAKVRQQQEILNDMQANVKKCMCSISEEN